MQIQDKKSIKAKALTINAIMRNPKLVATLTEALDAPVGSTKRKKAKAILRSLKQANINYFGTDIKDGQGGGGMPLASMMPKVKQIDNTKQVDDTKKMQEMEQNIQQTPMARIFVNSVDHLLARKNSKPNDGQGGAFDGSSLSSSINGSPSDNVSLFNNPFNIVTPNSTQPIIKKEEDNVVPTTGGPTVQESNLFRPSFANADTGTANSTTSMIIKPGESNVLQGGADGGGVYSWGPETNNQTTGTNQTQTQNQNTGFPTVDDLDKAFAAGGIKSIDEWYNGLDKSGKDMYADLYKAYKDGIGSAAWTQKALTDKNLLSKVLGVPKSALDMFPDTGLVSQQLIKLKNEKKKEYNLTAWEDKMNRMLNTGGTIKEDLTAYIRGKDQYLGTIDKMIDEASTQFANMDTSNPYAKQRTGMYMNYLTILKGRQNQRYANFLNSAINYYNADLQATERAYNDAYTKFKEAYTEESAMTTELFNNTKTLLADMYTNLEKREQKIADANKLKIEQQKTAYDIALDAINLKLKTLEYENKKSGITGTEKYDSNDLNSSMGITVSDKDGTTMNIFDANDAIAMATAAGQSETNAYNRFVSATQSYLNSQLKSSGDTSMINQFSSNFEGYQDLLNGNYGDLDKKTAANAIEATTALLDKIQSGAASGIKSYLAGQQETIEDLIDDINDGDDEDEVVDSYKGNISESMIRSIYEMIKSSGGEYKENIQTLANDLASYLAGNLY